MTDVTVRTFQSSEWPLYRALRLRALRESPDAFSTLHAEAAARSDSEWRDRMAAMSSRHDLPLLAEVGGNPAGIVWARIDPSTPRSAQLYQMWVAPECRGLGIGRKLLETAIEWATANGARSMALGVTVGNSPARRLYDGAGFVPIGAPEPLRPNSDLEVQNMQRTLAR
jgi:ribosomal protein S18 acetylase RimI-like enzyme